MSVTFSEEKNEVFTIPNNEEEDRSIGQMYYRNLIMNCENAEREMVKAINDHCGNQIILIGEGYPLTVRDLSIPWYRDDTVCKIWQYLQNNDEFANNFYTLFDQEVANSISLWNIKDLQLILGPVRMYFYKVLRTM